MTTLRTTGNTRQWKHLLKAGGWKWMPLQLSWSLEIDAETASAITDETTRLDTLRRIGGAKKGCLTTMDGVIVHRSATYVAPRAVDAPIDEYDLDAFGNFAAGDRIPGSLDRI